MVRDEFDEAFEELRDQSNKLAETERTTDNFDEIVEQRVEVDRLRDKATAARKGIVSRFEPPAPDVVLPARGASTHWLSKIGSAVIAALLAICVLLAFTIVRSIGDGFPLELEQVTEFVDDTDGCVWHVNATVRNGSDDQVTITRIETVLEREMRVKHLEQPVTIAAGATGTVEAFWRVGAGAGCPAPDDIGHGNLIIRLESGATASRGF